MAIWITSDLHLNHKNIIKMGANFNKFNSLEEYNEFIIQQYNSVVDKDDLVYILGDVGFTPKDALIPLVKRLNGRKILIVGNHDRLKDPDYKNMGFIEVIRHPVYYNNNIILSHIPVLEAKDNPWVINVHGHVHNGSVHLPNYFNANVDIHGWKPVNMEYYVKQAQEICRQFRWEPFGIEWYAEWEK